MTQTAYITRVAAFLPNEPITNDEIENILGKLGRQSTAVKRRVLMNNGITTRHYAIHPDTLQFTHTNVELTVAAITRLEQNGHYTTDQIQCLACGTSSADQLIPSHASMVHGALQSPPCEVIGTSGVCCSGMSALKYAYLNVASGCAANAVATGSELASPNLCASHFRSQLAVTEAAMEKQPMLAFSDEFLRWMLSDGAGAAWIDREPNAQGVSLRIEWLDLISFANESDVCMFYGMRKNEDGPHTGYRIVDDQNEFVRDGYLNLAQDVRVLQDRLPTLMPQAIRRTIDRRKLVADEIDWMLPHYSSKWFRQPLYEALKELDFEIPFERWYSNLPSKGNTGSASIYIILEELVALGKVKPGQRILCIVPESARMTFSLMLLTAV